MICLPVCRQGRFSSAAILTKDHPTFEPDNPVILGGWEPYQDDLYWCWTYADGEKYRTWAVEYLLIQCWQPELPLKKLEENIFKLVEKLYSMYGVAKPSEELLHKECSKMQIMI